MEMVDTRDLKSLAQLSMRVQVPPVLPSRGHQQYYDELRKMLIPPNELEVFVYTHRGELINLKSRWRTTA